MVASYVNNNLSEITLFLQPLPFFLPYLPYGKHGLCFCHSRHILVSKKTNKQKNIKTVDLNAAVISLYSPAPVFSGNLLVKLQPTLFQLKVSAPVQVSKDNITEKETINALICMPSTALRQLLVQCSFFHAGEDKCRPLVGILGMSPEHNNLGPPLVVK